MLGAGRPALGPGCPGHWTTQLRPAAVIRPDRPERAEPFVGTAARPVLGQPARFHPPRTDCRQDDEHDAESQAANGQGQAGRDELRQAPGRAQPHDLADDHHDDADHQQDGACYRHHDRGAHARRYRGRIHWPTMAWATKRRNRYAEAGTEVSR
jgi:hypothetical protein